MPTQRNPMTGISFDKSRPTQPYRVRVRVGNKQYFVGRYTNQEDAIKAKENFFISFKRKEGEKYDQYLSRMTREK